MNSIHRGGLARSALYDPGVVLGFFKSCGTQELVPQGATIFAENQKASRLLMQREKMYLLLQGEVNIVARDRTLGTVRLGEIFGEMAPLAQSARSASAVAKTQCRLIVLDERQFRHALEKLPEFALMLMGVMIGRLREAIARINASMSFVGDLSAVETAVLDRRLLADLGRALGDAGTVYFNRGQVILREGGAGVLMYAVLQGRVAATLRGRVVERIGPGGVLGEVALVDQAPRVASATAETDCTLLAIDRAAFLALVRTRPAFGVALLHALAERLRFLITRRR